MEIVLAINDFCAIPIISKTANEIRVTIGVGHNFDDILDVSHNELSNEQIAELHRLWADDTYPRNFTRNGDELIITARN
ncbi:MAG: hypothetical protein RLZZ159_808 [Actinomycetota bacterium]|jgi:hypothetical protein